MRTPKVMPTAEAAFEAITAKILVGSNPSASEVRGFLAAIASLFKEAQSELPQNSSKDIDLAQAVIETFREKLKLFVDHNLETLTDVQLRRIADGLADIRDVYGAEINRIAYIIDKMFKKEKYSELVDPITQDSVSFSYFTEYYVHRLVDRNPSLKSEKSKLRLSCKPEIRILPRDDKLILMKSYTEGDSILNRRRSLAIAEYQFQPTNNRILLIFCCLAVAATLFVALNVLIPGAGALLGLGSMMAVMGVAAAASLMLILALGAAVVTSVVVKAWWNHQSLKEVFIEVKNVLLEFWKTNFVRKVPSENAEEGALLSAQPARQGQGIADYSQAHSHHSGDSPAPSVSPTPSDSSGVELINFSEEQADHLEPVSGSYITMGKRVGSGQL